MFCAEDGVELLMSWYLLHLKVMCVGVWPAKKKNGSPDLPFLEPQTPPDKVHFWRGICIFRSLLHTQFLYTIVALVLLMHRNHLEP
jgi:hypothetical protein